MPFEITFLTKSTEYLKFRIDSTESDFSNNEVLLIKTSQNSDVVYLRSDGDPSQKMASQEIEIDITSGDTTLINTYCEYEIKSFDISDQKLGNSEGIELEFEAF
jgi:hypothetical protein